MIEKKKFNNISIHINSSEKKSRSIVYIERKKNCPRIKL